MSRAGPEAIRVCRHSAPGGKRPATGFGKHGIAVGDDIGGVFMTRHHSGLLLGLGALALLAAGCGGTSWLPGGGGSPEPGGKTAVAQSDLDALQADSAVMASGDREFVDTLMRRQLEALQNHMEALSVRVEETESELEELEQKRREYRSQFEKTRSRIETVRIMMAMMEQDPDYLNGDRIRKIRDELSTELPGTSTPATDPASITVFDDWQNPATGSAAGAVPSSTPERPAGSPSAPDWGEARGTSRVNPPAFTRQPAADSRPMADLPGSMRAPAVPPARSPSSTADSLPIEGKVIYIEGEGRDAIAYIDVGSDAGVEPGMYFSIGSGRTRNAVLVVDEVFATTSKSRVADSFHPVHNGDRAVRVDAASVGL